ncbi:galactokinase [Spirochaetota bacterium]
MRSPDSLYKFPSSKEGRQLFARLYGMAEAAQEEKRWKKLMDNSFAKTEANAVMISSPGRTELAGNHTDHNNGMVLCAAVQMDILACVMPQKDGQVDLSSDGWDSPFLLELNELKPKKQEKGRTEALIRGTAAALAKRGWKTGGFSGYMNSRIPEGSGLSSSAAVELLFGQIQSSLYNGGRIPAMDLALAGQFAENLYFGKPCGLMDQMAVALGGLSCIDFENSGKPAWSKAEFDFKKAGYSLVIVNTGSSHSNLTHEYSSIPKEMKDVASFFGLPNLRKLDIISLIDKAPELRRVCGDRAFLRAIHYIKENDRVKRMEAALKKGNIKEWLNLADESGRSSWQLLQNISPSGAIKEQPLAVALELSREFLGKDGIVRVHGGGFAGTIQAWVKSPRSRDYMEFMNKCLGKIGPDKYGEPATSLNIRLDGVREV